MANKIVTATLEGDGLRFIGSTSSGHRLVLDDGAGNTGPRPSELVPLAIAGCTAFDVISILRKKRQVVARYSVDAESIQMAEHPNAFTRIDIVHNVEGPGVEVAAVERAIELSARKYCSVGSTLASGITEVHHAYHVTDTATGAESTGEVLVLGPNADPRTPAD